MRARKQLDLFRMPRIRSRQIRELVRDRLHGFEFRQAARDEERRKTNARIREERRKQR